MIISASLILLHLAGAVCLLLWGARMVKLGFTRAFGTRLRRIVALGTANRFTSFGAGMMVTGFLQSSTAAALILISFAERHKIPLAMSLAMIIGADLATTLVAQILTFDLSWLAPALLTIGIIAHMAYEHGGRKRHLARSAIGIGLMLLALGLIRETSIPLRESDTLPLILAPLKQDPIIAVLVATFLTWLMHSSLAAVLLFSSLATGGVIDFGLALLLILGANLGGAFVAFVATYKEGPVAQQITVGNIIMRLFCILLTLPFVDEITSFFSITDQSNIARQTVNFHTLFNISLALTFLPFIGIFAKLCEKIVAEKEEKEAGNKPLYLDEKALNSPVIALAGAARETLRMAEMVEDMLQKTIVTFESGNEKLVHKVRDIDNDVDEIYKAIKLYMTRLSQEGLDPKEADRYIQILTFSTNLEHIGDTIDKSLMDLAIKKIKKQDDFSKEGFTEIKNLHAQVLENMRLAQTIFLSEDPKLAAQLVEGKTTIREAARDSSLQHFKRLGAGTPETIATSSLHLDIVRDYRRINSYITRVAFSIMENARQYEEKRKNS